MNSTLRIAAVGAALATLGISSTASAATATAQAQAEILEALSIEVVTGDDTLDFGTIAPGTTAGTAVLSHGGTVTCSGSLICVGTTNAPAFDVEGSAGKSFTISLPSAPVTLAGSAGGSMTVGSFTTANATLALDGDGEASFTIGGTLNVGAAQTAGVYTGTVEVTVEYS